MERQHRSGVQKIKMITFTQFLTEGRDAPLYHGTPMDTAAYILKRDMIEARTLHHGAGFEGKSWNASKVSSGEVSGVSLTRNLRMAKVFGSVVFELDQRKLTQTHKIMPYNYFNRATMDGSSGARSLPDNKYKATEAEEFVRGSIKNLDKYLITLWVHEKYRSPALETHPKVKFYK